MFSLDFPRALEQPRSTAVFKASPEDFRVTEVLGFEPDGAGEHVLVLAEKIGLTTPEAARRLAVHYGVRARDVTHAGIKDKQGIARQWFSLPMPIKQGLPGTETGDPCLRILRQHRHRRKLRPGSHWGNAFSIRLRAPRGPEGEVAERLARLASTGVPNYFGPQRFGNDGDNVAQALAWFRGGRAPGSSFHRRMLLSAARSWLFNYLLGQRVVQGNWNTWLDGDALMLDGTASFFLPESLDDSLSRRLFEGDVHPAGPLWGQGPSPTGNKAAALEEVLASEFSELCRGLEARGLRRDCRALRVNIHQPEITCPANGDLVVEFRLAKGSYATSVLREMVDPR